MEAGCAVAAVIENAASGPGGEAGSGDVPEGPCASDGAKDATLPPPAITPNPEKTPQELSTARMGSDDVTEPPPAAEPLLRSCVSTASMKVKHMKKLTFTRGHFPRLAECAHFHYENVDFGTVQLSFAEDQGEGQKAGLDSKELLFLVQIGCQGRSWLVKRSFEDFRVLDKHLHLCIFDRRFSQLAELPRHETLKGPDECVTKMLAAYLSQFSALADNNINCGPVLTWMEIDNKGNHLLVSEESSINVPAIAAAHVTKRYTAQAPDELTFEVGDIVSVIDMPPKEDTGWWRGKHGFQVGFFPCDCVELISEKMPPSVESAMPKPVCKKHGKLVTFLRSFMKSRPPPQKLRQRGILKERVFGCDLGEYLHNSGYEVPKVVRSCAEFIEKNGVVDGIYRLSGISSNIQKLRHEFDSEQVPDLSRDVFRQDIHSVGSLCKLYFRELPNPLLTYQLYERFSDAVSASTDEERLAKIHNVIQQLPPPHYRSLEFLMRHLSRLATFSPITNMHTKNLAIVWAPNLLRSKQIESACFSGTAAFMEVRIQSVVVEFILNNTEKLFSSKLNPAIRDGTGNNTLSRPKSLLVCSPSTKLLSLEEAQARTQAQLGSPATTPSLSPSEYIEVGEGPGALGGKFHTVIELPAESKRLPGKGKKSPVGNWLSFFHLGKSHSVSKRKLKRHPSEPNDIKSIPLPGGRGHGGTIRSTKSEESLTSLHTIEAEPSAYRPSRPRSTSEALSLSCKVEEPATRVDGHHGNRPASTGQRLLLSPAPPPAEEDDDDLDDLSPPAPGSFNLDFDPMSFQCSPPAAIPGPRQHTRHDGGSRKGVAGGSGPPVSSPPNGVPGQSRSPDLRGGRKGGQPPSSPSKLRKSVKTQRITSASAAAAAAPTTRADVIASSSSHRGHQGPPPDTPPPVPTSSPPSERCEAGPRGACGARRPHSSQSSQASALTELSQAAQSLPDPDRLVSSVSVLPPHPPMTSAARKLALALAESAQKASEAAPPQRRTAASSAHHGHHRSPSYPPPPPQRPDGPHPADRTPPTRPSVLHLQVQYCGPRGGQSERGSPQLPSDPHRCPHPSHHLLPTHRCCESPLQEPPGSPNASPLGSGGPEEGRPRRRCQRRDRGPPRAPTTEEEDEEVVRGGPDDGRWAEPTYHNVGVSTPTQSAFCAVRSPSGGGGGAVYANSDSVNVFNFRTVLAESPMPGSVGEVLPRPPPLSPGPRYDERTAMAVAAAMEDVYGRRHGGVLPGPPRSPLYPRPDALPFHLSRPDAAFRHSTEGRYPGTLGPKHPSSPQYGGRPGHGGELLMGGGGLRGPWEERPDEGRLRHPAMRRARSFHAPQFSHYEIAEAEVVPPEALYYVQKPPGSEPPYRWLLQSDFHPSAPFEAAPAPYGARYGGHFPTDGPAAGDPRFYGEAFRPGGIRHSQSYTLRSTVESTLEPGYYQPPPPPPPPPHRHAPSPHRDLFLDRREAAFYEARDVDSFGRRVYQPVRDHHNEGRYHSPTPAAPYQRPSPPPADPRGREIMHTRSRSDPGNACLFSGAGGGGDQQREASVVTVTALSPGHQAPALHVKPEAAQEPPQRKRESVHGRGPAPEGPPSKLPQRLPPDPRRDQPPLRKVPSLPERSRPQPRRQDQGGGGGGNRSHSRGREHDRLTLSNAVNSAGGPARSGVHRRAGRSQSIKENRRLHQANPPGAPLGSEPQGGPGGPAPPHRRTQSTRVRPTRYENAEGYYATPKAKAARAPKAGAGYFPGHGCMSPHRHRLLSKALGQGPFYHAGGRSEAGVYE
ncbi:rho GTPase-activating protein 32 isoform X2 [Gadus macrocephalus]|uniref:rho GTPase-activating protein 32 isoform X2 n=1 Tax=Gadus macrocephalus TaxID=80720 RepID=UPI0028CB7DA3|nr:rho GTPase-activating protein 32 isoform X2 [Gadus macrocephalus]